MSRKYSFNPYLFDKIDTPEKAYWLGALYTDGSVNKKGYVNFQVTDYSWVNSFKIFCEYTGPIQTYIRKDKLQYKPAINLTIYSPYLVEALSKLGVVPNKTYNHETNLYIPKNELYYHFLRGCIDGDGAIYSGMYKYTQSSIINGIRKVYKYNKRYYRINVAFSNCYIPLVNLIKEFFQMGYIKQGKNSKSFDYRSGPRTKKIIKPYLDILYKDSYTDIRLDRKYQVYLTCKEENLKVEYYDPKEIRP